MTLPDNEPSHNQTLLNEAWGEFQVEESGSFTFNVIKSVQSSNENINYVEVNAIVIQCVNMGTKGCFRATCDYETLIRRIMAHYCWQMVSISVTTVHCILLVLPIGIQ